MQNDKCLPTVYQQFIGISRYARWLVDASRRELWPETAGRYGKFFDEHFNGLYSDFINNELLPAICGLEVMPSMRALMTAGEALARENLAAYNCAYVAVNNKRAFSEALYILMCGTGVGFSCERQEIQHLPAVPEELRECLDVIVVGDSKEGWAKAFRKLISCLYEGDVPTLDYSRIRKAGARLKTFGGRASGPEPLRKLFLYTIQQFKTAKGRKLTSIEVHDLMCMIGEIVVVGGVRRSALISLSNLSDRRMQEAKMGQWWGTHPHRGLANNSVAYTEKPSVEIFMEEWLSLIRSKSGERGLFNRKAAQRQAARWGRRSVDYSYGVNPCLSGDTLVLVPGRGYQRIEMLAGTTAEVINQEGDTVSGIFEMTSPAERVYEVSLSNGAVITATRYHNFVTPTGEKVQVANLRSGDELMPVDALGMFGVSHSPKQAYLDAWLIADGTYHNNLSSSKLYLYGTKERFSENFEVDFKENCGRLVGYFPQYALPAKDHIPAYVLSGDRETVLAFVKGYLESDGHLGETEKGWTMQFSSIHRSFLQDLQALLRLLGARGKIALSHEARDELMPDGKGGMAMYSCKDCYRLTVSNPMAVMQHLHPELVKRGVYHKEERVFVESVTPTHRIIPVYCAGVEEANSFALPWVMSGNCGEIILRDKELCNLTEVIVRHDDTLDTLKRKVELATVMGTFQSTLTNFGFVSDAWAKNTAEERLLGVSLTGIFDNAVMAGSKGDALLIEWLNELRAHARAVNLHWAEKLGIPPSAAITCVKPSGTVSQLVDSASGIHPRHSAYYLRTVRLDKKDPVYRLMLDAGVYCEDEKARPDSTAVFYFPTKAPEGAVTRHDLTAIKHLELWSLYQKHWCEHNPSITVNVRESEWFEVGAWVYKNFDSVCGVTFLPMSEHTYEQAPYTDITEEEYYEWLGKHPMPGIDWEDLKKYEKEDNTISSQTLACTGNYCEIVGVDAP